MRNIWQKLNGFFRQIWNGLTLAGRVIVGIIIIGLAGLIVYAATNNTSNDNGDKKGPEVAQVYEPSIGSPLPADTNLNGAVSGASTTEPSNTTNNAPEDTITVTERVAPPTGVNPDAPIKYENLKLGFAAILPARSNVTEADSQIRFTSKDGQLQYVVSVNNTGTDTLSSIEAQLNNSPTAKNIVRTKFAGSDALQFSAEGYGAGVVFVVNGKTYYLLGNQTHFASFEKI